MKNLKLFSMAILAMAITLASCSGSDGEQGIPGEDGTDGINGVDGADGNDGADGADGISCWDLNGNGVGDITVDENNEDINLDGVVDALDCQGASGQNGQNGNANVEKIDFLITDFAGTDFTVNLGLSQEEMNSYAFLYYLEVNNGFDDLWYSVPGPLGNNTRYSRVYANENNADVNVFFYNTSDDSAWDVPQGTFTQFRVVSIEFSSQGNKSAQESVISELKDAGIDTSDYYAVAAYFGLE
ncbi:collagen-like protein [Muricauda sp. 334s03]|uniref:Collagen-like protein n=1 Tax=Flagellimonas yonaguniensis TaxID=3031325 RepID=A0ABT5XU11_9FLAO|nr:collagen-like protein [[Muricauda] yonaguniensis]MDF0714640.1 collagen-like protein [[Muricauda] yonaguniensis]